MTYFNAVKYICSSSQGAGNTNYLSALLARLGNPQKRIKYVRLAGSNGKTVCAEMLMSVLAKSGYTVGCLRMPTREDPRENVCIGTECVPVDEFCELVHQVKTEIEGIRKDGEGMSDFSLGSAEILLAVALLAFCKHRCDVCFIESNHFGNDPSMVLPPPFAAVICGTIPSGDEHEISRIRSYICRGIEEIVSAPQDSDAYKIIFDTCYDISCRLTLPVRSEVEIVRLSLGGTEFLYKGESYSISLCGGFQVYNAVLALEVIEMLSRKGFVIDHKNIVAGLKQLRIPAKVEVVSIRPLIIVDTTHTPIAVQTVCESIFEIIGKSAKTVRLCLPDAALARDYIDVIEKNGYRVDRAIIADAGEEELNCEVTCASGAKAFVKAALDKLDNENMLIISGNSKFVKPIRYQLLSSFGF